MEDSYERFLVKQRELRSRLDAFAAHHLIMKAHATWCKYQETSCAIWFRLRRVELALSYAADNQNDICVRHLVIRGPWETVNSSAFDPKWRRRHDRICWKVFEFMNELFLHVGCEVSLFVIDCRVTRISLLSSWNRNVPTMMHIFISNILLKRK